MCMCMCGESHRIKYIKALQENLEADRTDTMNAFYKRETQALQAATEMQGL